jgi:hypothetical protein
MAPAITITQGPGSGAKAGVARTADYGAAAVSVVGTVSDIRPGLIIEARVMSGANEIVGWTRPASGFVNDGTTFKGTYAVGGGREIAITSVTAHATTPVVTLSANHGWASGLTFPVVFNGTSGGPAGWEGGTFTATSTGLNTFTVSADTSTLTPTGGEIVLDVLIPSGGFYTFEFRTIDLDGSAIWTDTTQTATWGVGVFGVILGQSNMQDMHETIDTPDVADAKVGFYVNSVGTGGTHAQNVWFDPVVTPTGNGITKLANELQAHVTADYGDIPVFIVSLAVAGSALTPSADYAGGGFWHKSEQDRSELYTNTLANFDTATPHRNVEFILWQQGEAEATKTGATTLTIGGTDATRNIWNGGWQEPFESFLRWLRRDFITHTGSDTPVPVVVGHLAPLFTNYLVQRLFASSTIKEDQTKAALDNDLGLVAAMDVDRQQAWHPGWLYNGAAHHASHDRHGVCP